MTINRLCGEFISGPARVAFQGRAPRVKPRRLLPWGSYHLPFVTCKFVHLDALAAARAVALYSLSVYRSARDSRSTPMASQKSYSINLRTVRDTGRGEFSPHPREISSTWSFKINCRNYDHPDRRSSDAPVQLAASRARNLAKTIAQKRDSRLRPLRRARGTQLGVFVIKAFQRRANDCLN